MSETPTRLEQLEKLRADRLAEKAKAQEAQYLVDLEARIALEEEYGTVACVEVTRFVPGQPTRAFIRTPKASEYKRYKAHVFASAQKKKNSMSLEEAQEQLATACWIYPPKEAQSAMLDAFPGLLTPLGAAASALAEGKTEEEGKD